MKHTYNYDDIYGTLIYHNKEDTVRKYFIIECQYYKFYRWMFKEGWCLRKRHTIQRNGLKGFEVTLRR
jgi:hypothetical protein